MAGSKNNPNCRGKETQRVCCNILKYSFLQRLRKMPWAHVRGMIWLEICNDGQIPTMTGSGGPPPPHWGPPGGFGGGFGVGGGCGGFGGPRPSGLGASCATPPQLWSGASRTCWPSPRSCPMVLLDFRRLLLLAAITVVEVGLIMLVEVGTVMLAEVALVMLEAFWWH